MATIAAGNTAEHSTLAASTVTTVTFTNDVSVVEVINVTGTAAIYFTYSSDGSTPPDPTVGGARSRVLPAAISVDGFAATGGEPPVVKLISAGTPGYAVQGS